MVDNIIVTLVIAAILGLAIRYIVRAKQRGVKCIGCPAGETCKGHCGGASGCESGCACSANASVNEADVAAQADGTAQQTK